MRRRALPSSLSRHARPCAGHPRFSLPSKTWMAGTSPAMTNLMIVAVLEAAQDRLDPPRADLGARHVRRRAIMQRGIRPLQPCLRESAIAEHLLGVVRDA